MHVNDQQSFLGMLKYLARLSSHITKLAVPLCALIRKIEEFIWLSSHQTAFANYQEIDIPSIMKRVNKSGYIEVDANNVRGRALLQPSDHENEAGQTDQMQPIAFVSKLIVRNRKEIC